MVNDGPWNVSGVGAGKALTLEGGEAVTGMDST